MTLDVEFARLIDATPEEVFDAFTDPEGQEAFYGQDDPGWIVQSQFDLRVGGVWTVAFGPSPRELYRHRHVFQLIDHPHRLVLASTETRLDGSSFHTQLEFTFEARAGKTLMTMTQRGFPTAELREEHERGVPNAFARLERLIQLRGTPTDARHDSPYDKGERQPRTRAPTRTGSSAAYRFNARKQTSRAASARRLPRTISGALGRARADPRFARDEREHRSALPLVLDPFGQSVSPALADIIGARRVRTAVMISSGSIPCR